MKPLLRIAPDEIGIRFLGSRDRAREIRHQVEKMLAESSEVRLDFSDIQVGQSFVDELVGVLLLVRGPGVLEQLIFKSCSPNVRAAIEFVVADRYDEYMRTKAH
jgi:hypothetical protein